MTADDDTAAKTPPAPAPKAPAPPPAPTVRDLLASCAAARTVSTPPSDDERPARPASSR